MLVNYEKIQTESEAKLWELLKDRDLMKVKFRRQHPVGEYIADFYSREAKLVIELDGEQHAQESNTLYDQKRSKYLNARGLKVLRYWNDDVQKEIENVLEEIMEVVQKRTPHQP